MRDEIEVGVPSAVEGTQRNATFSRINSNHPFLGLRRGYDDIILLVIEATAMRLSQVSIMAP
jgi:hypothetical protein